MSDIKTMTDEQLETHIKRLYSDWMYEKTAERGYDEKAARAAEDKLLNAQVELSNRSKSNMELAEDLKKAVEAVISPC